MSTQASADLGRADSLWLEKLPTLKHTILTTNIGLYKSRIRETLSLLIGAMIQKMQQQKIATTKIIWQNLPQKGDSTSTANGHRN